MEGEADSWDFGVGTLCIMYVCMYAFLTIIIIINIIWVLNTAGPGPGPGFIGLEAEPISKSRQTRA